MIFPEEVIKVTLNQDSPKTATVDLNSQGFMATVVFTEDVVATIDFYIGASPDDIIRVEEWSTLSDSINGDVFDAETDGRYIYIKIECDTDFSCDVRLVRR